MQSQAQVPACHAAFWPYALSATRNSGGQVDGGSLSQAHLLIFLHRGPQEKGIRTEGDAGRANAERTNVGCRDASSCEVRDVSSGPFDLARSLTSADGLKPILFLKSVQYHVVLDGRRAHVRAAPTASHD